MCVCVCVFCMCVLYVCVWVWRGGGWLYAHTLQFQYIGRISAECCLDKISAATGSERELKKKGDTCVCVSVCVCVCVCVAGGSFSFLLFPPPPTPTPNTLCRLKGWTLTPLPKSRQREKMEVSYTKLTASRVLPLTLNTWVTSN